MAQLKQIKPRKYQEEIAKKACQKNTLVILPTGLGKTLIAVLVALEVLNKKQGKILWLAPTRPLVMQHYKYWIKHVEDTCKVAWVTGKIQKSKRKEIYKEARVIFATPQTIKNDLAYFPLHEVDLLIQDECHRCLKEYAYKHVAKEFLKIKPRLVFGMTASPGVKIERIKEICNNLGIEQIEICLLYTSPSPRD